MEDDWNIECSDEEFKDVKGPWEPEPEEIERLYSILEKNEIIELNWKCPGYRSPSPELSNEPQDNLDYEPIDEKTDFDFLDEGAMLSPKLKIRREGEETPKGSAKKKVTSLDGVISNMRRHKMLPSQTKQ